MMELEAEANELPEAANFEVGDDADVAAFANERCGICMDIIIDRGVLDCCQHWFCFACIDNWATVTNICPLCQKEFQLITCIPIYDTIGNQKTDEDSFPRDDDWCIQGNCNTLSFPSYYIDENAVICLDGDGCKIRNGLVAVEENLNLDTSIACDSCDLWYHAYCVGFIPESSTNNSWLCPRCIIDEVPPESDWISAQSQGNQFGPETVGPESSIDAGFSGKVSVSVADAGETAVVVSLLEKVQRDEESSDNILAVTEYVMDPERSNSDATGSSIETQLKEASITKPKSGEQESSLELSSLQDTSLTHNELVMKSYDKAILEPNVSDGCSVPSLTSFQPCSTSVQSESDSSTLLHLEPSLRSSSSGNQVAGNMQQHDSAKASLSVRKMDSSANANVVGLGGAKRKCMISKNYVEKYICTENDDGEVRGKKLIKPSLKKARPEKKLQLITQKCEAHDSALKDFQKSSRLVEISEDGKLLGDQNSQTETSDIMSIVRGTDQKFSEGHQCPESDKSTRHKDNAAGLRVKKIMRRATEGKESLVLVQKLRQEIREAVCNNSSKDLDKNIFDPKLLSAFRAAIAGPRTEPVQKVSPPIVRMKRSVVSKGKIRENLTKKIYGTAGGKRRRAWDRDWEIEFWKHRCMKTSQPEKVETLKLVLDLLNKGPGSEQESEKDMENPILSRLYLADASVFPRKDDIKPLSVLTDVGDQKKKDECKTVEKVSIPIQDNHMVQTPMESLSKDSVEMGNPSFDNKGKKSCPPSLKGEATCRNVHPHDCSKKANSVTLSSCSKIKSQSKEEMAAKSNDVKMDKRKWALEVLARKTARDNKDENQGKEENVGVLKGNYPLLAQLPPDMRPILAPSRHNKVPISVRQVQLYRLTEHLLKKENLPVIRRTAATELAVADAVNIEREVADRSNSKLVYINLCSQVLSQHSNNKKGSEAVGSKSSPPSEDTTGMTEPVVEDTSPDPTVEDALRMAGLISDSPPNSPSCLTNNLDDNDPTEKVEEGGTENVFDMDSHPELDIYGDFDYDLEDEDYIGTSALKASIQPEHSDMKMKVIFSTLNTEKTKNDQDSEEDGRLQTVEAPMDFSGVLKGEENGGLGISTLQVKENAPCLPPEILQDEGDEEPSLAECEELYGPDKEPLEKRFSQIASTQPEIMIGDSTSTEKTAFPDNERCNPNMVARSSNVVTDSHTENTSATGIFVAVHDSFGGEKSPNLSVASQNVQGKELESNDKQSGPGHSISKKVEAYIKEHIRPLCKSGVITAEQYRWAVVKTTEKVMKYHSKAKNANFLIKEGEKIKKLAEQYAEAAQQKATTKNGS